MAKVSLRIYNRDIERLIEQGQMDEAIAHCRHILKTFPKHLETYRVLGKAYLEARRYNEVVEVFSRLLMAVPDDFVAHVGLSIIRDEENKLDDAIWHMERAFETQPSNSAIQGELQRLYGRRDGVEPPKIRMTRGALARIYVQGELYPQAISEIRGVLAEDPQRTDMQVLLALSYFKSGQKSDASDLCNQLLRRYPYCFDANRIMVDLLPATAEATESTQVYRMRIGELDPYANFVKGSIFQTADVSDASISLERLEYTGEDTDSWDVALGIGLEGTSAPALAASTSDDTPDWLRGPGSETPLDSSMPGSYTPEKDEIPDFLRAAGWGESNGLEQPTSIFDDEPAAADDLVPADLPDWLKEQTPEAATPSPEDAKPTPEAIETPDWLSGLGETEQPADTPDWLSGLGGVAEQPAETPQEGEPADLPDWLSGLGDAGQPAESPEIAQNEPIVPADIPDWLKDADPGKAAPPAVESAGTSAEEQDDAIAWLESLAAKHGAKPEELVTDPNKRSDTPPDWVAQAQSAGETQSQLESKLEDLGASAAEQDDAIAWLESLAAKHGAKPEELVTNPNKRSDIPPDWVAQAQSMGEAQSPAEEPAETEWVEGAQNVGEQFFSEFEQASVPAVDETGMWLRNLEDKTGEAESAEVQQEPASGEAIMQDQNLSEWLSSLDEEPGLQLDPELLRASQRPPFQSPTETEPEAEPAKPDLPAWLSETEETQMLEEADEWKPTASTPTEEPVPVTLTADLPDWLQGMDEEKPAEETSTVAGEEDTPPWLRREQWESEAEDAQPTPTSPSDWHPVVEEAELMTPPSTQTARPMGESFAGTPPPPKPGGTTRSPAPAKKKASATPRRAKGEGQGNATALNQAKAELDRGDIPTALDHFGKLIKKGKYLEEIITALNDSLYRYPVEVAIWQTLGDAYMRANRLKEALDAYNKAEELIR
jgi:tetratricopeptide (TPR) repeat protein